MMTVDDALKISDVSCAIGSYPNVLAAEVRRLREELDSANARAEAAEADAASWADQCSQRVADWDEMRIRAETAEAVLQNLMSFLSVNGSWADLSADEAEKRIRDGIDMLMRPVLASAEAAEAALKEAQEQEPVAYYKIQSDGSLQGPLMDNDRRMCKLRKREWTPLYASPVPAPAVAVPAVPTDEQIHAAYREALGQSIRERDLPEIRKFARALLQPAPQPTNGDAK